jgi:hypothetical protein
MLESEDLIQFALSIDGEVLNFNTFSIKALLGFRTELLISSESTVYKIEEQEYYFQISSADCLTNNIKIDDEFYMENRNYIFYFKIKNTPRPYLDGWTKLSVDRISSITV